MKKISDYLKNRGLYAGWFGVVGNWGSDAFTSVEGIVGKVTLVMNSAIYASALVAVVVIVYGGITIITAAGDSDKYETGMKAVENAIIGMIVVFLASTIIKFVVEQLFK